MTKAHPIESLASAPVIRALQRIAAGGSGLDGGGWQEASVAVEEAGFGVAEFWGRYQEPNRPVIVKGVTANWRATREWLTTRHDGGRAPNFGVLKELFGEDEVCVAHCGEKHFSDQRREDMTMRTFLELWEHGDKSSEFLYCKDWHFANLHRDYKAYECPQIFSEDWLNRWYDARGSPDDYRFCYMGRKGTWTPLHRDVLRSFSWSANILGRKLWVMYPPGEEPKLRDEARNLVWNVEGQVDSAAFPRFREARCVRVVQNEGDAIFVPSGWWHQVVNLDDCLSINHNWINSCNIGDATAQVIEDHGDVVRSIEESCGRSDDFPRVCEELMQAHAGINLKGFSDLLSHCATEEAVIATSCRGDGDAMIASAFRLVKLRAAVGRVAEVPHAKWLAKHGDLDGDTGEIQRVVDQALRGLSEGWEGGVEAGALLASLVDAE